MNEMAARLEIIQFECKHGHAPKKLSELEAFLFIDSLLASLNRQYLDAKRHRQQLVALYGPDDAMAEVAMDMEDSAWCAMQTRYIELRQQGKLMEQAQRMMREAEQQVAEALERERKRDKEKEFQQYLYWTKILAHIRELNKTPHIFEWAILMLIFRMEPFNDRRKYKQQVLAA